MERESSMECSVTFLWTNESFSRWNCLSNNSTLFLHGGSLRLACFGTNRGSEDSLRILKKLEVHSVLYGRGTVRFLKKGNFRIYKGFMDVYYILTSAWKKNHKMSLWNWLLAMWSTCVSGSTIQLLLGELLLGLTYGFFIKNFLEIKLFICPIVHS